MCIDFKALVRPLCHGWILFRSDLDWFGFFAGKPGQQSQMAGIKTRHSWRVYVRFLRECIRNLDPVMPLTSICWVSSGSRQLRSSRTWASSSLAKSVRSPATHPACRVLGNALFLYHSTPHCMVKHSRVVLHLRFLAASAGRNSNSCNNTNSHCVRHRHRHHQRQIQIQS